MGYDPEKYKDKRDRVLGVKKRGVGFAGIMGMAAVMIISGLSVVTVPQAVSYMATRHLDDAIYRIEDGAAWSKALIEALKRGHGIASVAMDTHQTRLVITFDRRITDPSDLEQQMTDHGIFPVLLNRVNHRQRVAITKAEEESEAL